MLVATVVGLTAVVGWLAIRETNKTTAFLSVPGSWLATHVRPFASARESLAWAALLGLALGVAYLLQWTMDGTLASFPREGFEAYLIVSVILAPIGEEAMFRWSVRGLFIKHRDAMPIAMVWSSLLWIAFHYVQQSMTHDLSSVPTDLVLAGILTKAALGRRWWLGWPVHAAYNLLVGMVAVFVS